MTNEQVSPFSTIVTNAARPTWLPPSQSSDALPSFSILTKVQLANMCTLFLSRRERSLGR